MNGKELKQAGLALAQLNAGSWVDETLDQLATFCKVRKAEKKACFRFEEFRLVLEALSLDAPKSHKAWGCLPRLATQRGLITWTGRHEPALSAKTHGHYVKVWEVI
jgi:hypothetical protein